MDSRIATTIVWWYGIEVSQNILVIDSLFPLQISVTWITSASIPQRFHALGYHVTCMDLFAILFESIIRFPSWHGFPGFLKPPSPHFHLIIEFRHIGFDVQKWGAVKNVHILNVQHTVFDLVQLNNWKPNRVRTLRCTGGKESPWLRIHERYNMEVEWVATWQSTHRA